MILRDCFDRHSLMHWWMLGTVSVIILWCSDSLRDHLSHHSLMDWWLLGTFSVTIHWCPDDSYGPSQSKFSDRLVTIRDHLSHHSLVPPLSLTLSLSLTVLLSLQPCSNNLLTFVVDITSLYLCLSLPLCFMCTQPIVMRWIEVSIFPVFSICYANLNKRYHICT